MSDKELNAEKLHIYEILKRNRINICNHKYKLGCTLKTHRKDKKIKKVALLIFSKESKYSISKIFTKLEWNRLSKHDFINNFVTMERIIKDFTIKQIADNTIYRKEEK